MDGNSAQASGVRAVVRPACWLAVLLCWLLPLAGILHAQESEPGGDRRIIVAIDERPDPAPMTGSSARGYGGLPNYSGSERTLAISIRLARDHGLTEISAWTIDPLRVRCMLYEIAPGRDRDEVLTTLRQDRRVKLAQAQQEFSTMSSPAVPTMEAGAKRSSDFNDPYVALQTGFVSIGAASAQRLANGDDILVALVDTGVDAGHPDLQGRIGKQRDFVGQLAPDPGLDRHGTEVAGVIAAVANNGIGIVGVAPGANILAYRACWPVVAGASAAHCNSFTLAQALSAAIDSGAQIINLSLGGPHDALLEELLDVAFDRGKIVVGATPANGIAEGFPSGVAGVIAVGASVPGAGPASDGVLHAPGDQILTLEPGGSYDYASGSSLAAAHVTGTIALLLQLEPKLDAPTLTSLLSRTSLAKPGQIDACAAVHSANGGIGSCPEPLSQLESTAYPPTGH